MSAVEDLICSELDTLEGIDSALIEKVKSSIQSRAKAGLEKYGVTLEREDLSESEWLTHLQEELLDAIGYSTRIQMISDEHKDELLFNELKGYLFYFIVQVQKLIELESFFEDDDNETNLYGTEV